MMPRGNSTKVDTRINDPEKLTLDSDGRPEPNDLRLMHAIVSNWKQAMNKETSVSGTCARKATLQSQASLM